jgi:hypothetical protein
LGFSLQLNDDAGSDEPMASVFIVFNSPGSMAGIMKGTNFGSSWVILGRVLSQNPILSDGIRKQASIKDLLPYTKQAGMHKYPEAIAYNLNPLKPLLQGLIHKFPSKFVAYPSSAARGQPQPQPTTQGPPHLPSQSYPANDKLFLPAIQASPAGGPSHGFGAQCCMRACLDTAR